MGQVADLRLLTIWLTETEVRERRSQPLTMKNSDLRKISASQWWSHYGVVSWKGARGGGGSGLGDNPSARDSFKRQQLGDSKSDFRASAQPRKGQRRGSSLAWGNHTVRKSPRQQLLWGDRSSVDDMISCAISSWTPKVGTYSIPIFQCVFDDAWLLIANTIGLRVGSDQVDQTFFP